MVRVVKRSKAGKTLIVDVEFVGDRIAGIVISGDFFAYPEEVVEKLEEELRNKRVSEVGDFLKRHEGRVVLVGVTMNDIVEAIMDAYRVFQRS